MKMNRLIVQMRRRRGSVIATALFLTALAAIGTLLMSRTLLDQQRLNDRRRDLWRSFLIAEAGVAQVQHWGLYPDDYTPNTNLFEVTDPTSNVPGERFGNLAAALNGGGVTIDQEMLEQAGITAMTTGDGTEMGRIVEIQLLPPEVSDPVACFFKVQSTGESDSGLQRVVLAYMGINPVTSTSLAVPAALISLNTGNTFGNGKIHWGEAWSKNDFDMDVSPNNMSYLTDDPWAIYRTEEQVNFSNNWKVGNNSNTDHLHDPSADLPGLFPNGEGDFKDNFVQNVPPGTLDWPDFLSEYQTFKDLAMSNGRYYSTDSSGNIYRDGDESSTPVDFLTEFGIADRSSAPFDLVFIDTVDGNPPALDGSNLAQINVSGNGLGLKGIFYINANFDANGVGSPPSVEGVDPDGNSATLQKIFHHGLLYSSGWMSMGGNAGIYGSVVAERGFDGGGTPDIYYDSDLADGIDLTNGNAGSPFNVVLRTNFGVNPGA